MRARFSKLPDLEKLLAKIFTYSVKHSVKAIYFEDVNLAKMKDFRTLQLFFKEFSNTIDIYTNLKDELKSERLRLLLTTEDEGGLIPSNIQEAIKEFDDLIVWKTVAGPTKIQVPEPQNGIDDDFDKANDTVNDIKSELENYCEEIRK